MNPNEEKQNPELKPIVFQQLTDGLGFHNATEPEVASPKVKSAVQRARSIYQSTTPTVNAPTPAQPAAPAMSAPVQKPVTHTPTTFQKPLPQKPAFVQPAKAPAPILQPAATYTPPVITPPVAPVSSETVHVGKVQLASVSSRVCAYLIDLGIHFLAGTVLMSVLLYKADFTLSLLGQPWALAILGVTLYCAHALLLSLQEILFQTSIGKKVLGLQVLGNPLVLFLRATVFHLTFFVFCIGPIFTLFRKDKKGLHDVITDTTVQSTV